MKKRKVKIVIEETGEQDGKAFNVYMEGDVERIGKTDKLHLSPAEFWGSEFFRICREVMVKTGALQTITEMDRSKH